MEAVRDLLLQAPNAKIVLQVMDASAGRDQVRDEEGSEENNKKDDEVGVRVRAGCKRPQKRVYGRKTTGERQEKITKNGPRDSPPRLAPDEVHR